MFKRFLISFLTILALTFGFAAVAGAQDDDCEASSADVCEGTDVGTEVPEDDDDEVTVGPKTLPDTEVQGRQQLPVTGSETVTLILGGAALVAAGGLMVRRSTQAA